MVAEVRAFVIEIPTTATVAAPYIASLAMPARIVREIRARFPSGSNGEVGIAFGSGGQRVVPWNSDGWLVGSNESMAWPLENQIESGAWQLIAYNTGQFPHTVYVQFLVDPPALALRSPLGFRLPIPPAALSRG